MDLAELAALVADLRAEGNDLAVVEVKRASAGYPESASPSLSAFGNTPGGGTIIFGLDESSGFESVGVYDVVKCKQAVANSARNSVEPPLTLDAYDFSFEGKPVVVAVVNELPSANKPCRVKSNGKAYLRSYDGDYALSELEEQAFLANRSTPRFDQEVVAGATRADLDESLVDQYYAQSIASSSALERYEKEELLFRTGVLVGDQRSPSLAGLLALGSYPQQYVPNLVIQASVDPGASDPSGTRVADSKRFDGPLPVMLDEAVRWVARNTRTRIRFGPGGVGRDEPEYPLEAVRELLSNALVHRDLGPYALGEAITLRLQADKLVLSNPGGLYGLTAERLGQTGVTSARNGYLVRICQNVRADGGSRVVEALATGIPTVLREVAEAGMVPPRFYDQGIRFSVLMPNHALLAPDDLRWLGEVATGHNLSDTHRHVLVQMRHGTEFTNKSLRDSFPMDSRDAKKLLTDLVDAGLAQAQGERGGRVYQLASRLEDDSDEAESGEDGAEQSPESAILRALEQGPATRAQLQDRTGRTRRQVQYALSALRASQKISMVGGRGRTTLYIGAGSPTLLDRKRP